MRYSLTRRLNVSIPFAFACQLLFIPAISQTLIVDDNKRVAVVQSRNCNPAILLK